MCVNTHAHTTFHDWLCHDVLNRISLPQASSPETVWKFFWKREKSLDSTAIQTLDRPTGSVLHPRFQLNCYRNFFFFRGLRTRDMKLAASFHLAPYVQNYWNYFSALPISVAARSKAWVCGRSHAGIAGSNPAGNMDVTLLWLLLSDRGLCDWPIALPEELYRVWCIWMWSWSLDNGDALAH